MNIYTPVFVITPVLLTLSIGLIGFVFQYQRKLLQHQEHLRKLQEAKQQQLLDATVQAQEEERRRVARDLHDDVGAMLALVKLNIHQLNASSTNKAAGVGVKQLLDDVIGSVRRISQDLLPVVLEKMGLAEAIVSMKRAIPANSGISFDFECDDMGRRFPAKTELLLFRVIQELFNNTLKHAQASNIKVKLSVENEELRLEYSDNGKGFDYNSLLFQEQDTSIGLGIMNLHARVALLKGSFNLQSELNNGVSAIITIPVL
jgi:signal transduction histidine kinase